MLASVTVFKPTAVKYGHRCYPFLFRPVLPDFFAFVCYVGSIQELWLALGMTE